MSLYIGLMSGTSMDGIDAALIDVAENTLLHGITLKYSAKVTSELFKLLVDGNTSLAALCQLNSLIGREFANAVNELLSAAKISLADIDAIGSHGQTVCHNTASSIPYTLQLGCAHTISSLTGITVVADFRTRDIVLGGQGAPLAPLYHQQLFADKHNTVGVVNIGGISNITFINPNAPIKGWDIGPGNCLMDAWIMMHQHQPYDAMGRWAQQGTIIEPLLDLLLADPFIVAAGPKSIGKEYFSLLWLQQYLKKEYQAVDIQKTLLMFTAKSIAYTVLNEKNKINTLYLCGGGVHNLTLLSLLRHLLPEIYVASSAEVGVDPDYLEAMMFAWLAAKTLQHIPIDLSTITGSPQPVILGAIYPATK